MHLFRSILRDIKMTDIFSNIIGSAIASFGIYNIHDISHVTEGGIIGLDLLLDHCFSVSPAFTNLLLTAVCFMIGWKALGRTFVVYSAFAVSSFSLFYAVWEHTPRLWPELAKHPWSSALAGAFFIGVGCGLCVSHGGAQSGDDALAMAIHHYFQVKLSTVYIISDLFVLLLSLTYIPLSRIACSLLTVLLSGQIIELVVMFSSHLKRKSVSADEHLS